MTPPSFADLRAVAAAAPPAPPGARAAARDPAAWLAAWQGRSPARLDRVRLALFAAGHGATLADDPGAALRTRARITGLIERHDPLAAAAERLDADLKLYELAPERPSADRRRGPAMDEATAAGAAAYGMMAVEDGLDLVVLAAVSAGADAAAAAVEAALEAPGAEPLAALAAAGGADIAGLVGAMLAARLARTPVLALDAASRAARRVAGLMLAGGAGHVATELGDEAEAAVLALRAALAR